MTPSETMFALSNELLRTHANLIRNCLDIIDLCLNDHSDIARSAVVMLTDNVVLLAEEVREKAEGR